MPRHRYLRTISDRTGTDDSDIALQITQARKTRNCNNILPNSEIGKHRKLKTLSKAEWKKQGFLRK